MNQTLNWLYQSLMVFNFLWNNKLFCQGSWSMVNVYYAKSQNRKVLLKLKKKTSDFLKSSFTSRWRQHGIFFDSSEVSFLRKMMKWIFFVKYRIYIGRLNNAFTKDEIYNMFVKYGEIVDFLYKDEYAFVVYLLTNLLDFQNINI